MINALLVGYGRFGEEHLVAWEATGRARVGAIVDPRLTERIVTSPDGTRTIPVFEHLSRVPVDSQPDVAAVVTPVWSHKTIVDTLVERRIPCLVEKPLAPTSTEGQEISDTASRSGVLCMPGHMMRFSPAHAEIRSTMATRGFPVVNLNLRRDRSEALLDIYPGEHPALLTGIHDIDLAVWFTNSPIASVQAERAISGAQHAGFSAQAKHANGSASTISGHYCFPRQSVDATSDEIRIEGANGETLAHIAADSQPDATMASPNPVLVKEIEHFLDLFTSVADTPLVTPSDAVHCLAVVEAIIHSSESGGRTVEVRASQATTK